MKVLRVIIQILLIAAVLAGGFFGYQKMVENKAQVNRKKRPVRPPAVRFVETVSGPVGIRVLSDGTVRTWRETSLANEVAGRVVGVSPNLIDGGFVAAGEVLIKIDQTDYRLNLTLTRAQLKEAETALGLGRAEADQAQAEWSKLNRGKAPPLVAKAPQLAQAQAALQAARARVRQAELKLSRTELKAPFAGRVKAKLVDLGQYLGVGKTVVELDSTEAAEITVLVESKDLAWLSVPGLTGSPTKPGSPREVGSPAVVRVELAGEEREWPGRIVRAQARIDAKTRLIPVVVRVEAPYAQVPPLVPGLFAQVELQGREIPQATLIPRAGLRAGDTVWVVTPEQTIRFQKVRVVRYLGDRVVLSPALADGTRVVVSELKAVSPGMRVRATGQDAIAAQNSGKPGPGKAEKPGEARP